MANRQMARLFLVDMIQDAHFSHFEENPLVQGTVLEAAPKAVIGYDHRNGAHDAETWLHFYVYDHRFLPLCGCISMCMTIAFCRSTNRNGARRS